MTKRKQKSKQKNQKVSKQDTAKQQDQPSYVELPYGKKLHPLAAHVPDYAGDRTFEELVADVKANGLRDPITLTHDGKFVVDGRHRLLACEQAGVKHPKFEKLPKNASIIPFIISKLIHRSLSASQRAAIAAELMADFVKNDKKGARAKAAKDLHVSEGYVHAATKLKDEDPEKFEDVKAGKLKLSKARPKKATPKKNTPAKVVETPDEEEQDQEQDQVPVEQQDEGSGSDPKTFGVWEQAHQYLIGFVSYLGKLDGMGEDVADLVVGARTMQKQFAKVRRASSTGAVAVAS